MELAVLASVVGAIGQYQAGQAQQQIYQAQAQQEEIKERKFLDEQATLRHQRAIFDSSR